MRIMILLPAKLFMKVKEIIKYLGAIIFYKIQWIIGIALQLFVKVFFVLNYSEKFLAYWFQKLNHVE